MINDLTVKELFKNLDATIAKPLFENAVYPWEVLEHISHFIKEIISTLDTNLYDVSGDTAIAKSAKIAPSASISSPCIIGEDTELRTGAFIRGSVIIGKGCVVGNSCEVKNSILFDVAQVPHFNYVGDSVLGYRAHMGAGAITSNVKLDKSDVVIQGIPTNRRKIGAIIGDMAEIGCNSVLNPGAIVGRESVVYPLSSVRGVVEKQTIYKSGESVVFRNL